MRVNPTKSYLGPGRWSYQAFVEQQGHLGPPERASGRGIIIGSDLASGDAEPVAVSEFGMSAAEARELCSWLIRLGYGPR